MAGTIPIGQKCNTGNNSECITNDCEDSNLDIEKDDFCVCKTPQHCEDHFGNEGGGTWKCESGSAETFALHYCIHSKNGPKGAIDEATLDAINTGKTEFDVAGGISAPITDSPTTTEFEAVAPQLAIPIPGLDKFTNYKVTAGETISSPWIAQYLVAIYSYAVTLASIAAVASMIIGGLMYMTSAANEAMIGRAKSIIFSSISGLAIILSAHMILQFINPNLTDLKSVTTETIASAELPDLVPEYPEGEFEDISSDGASTLSADVNLEVWQPKSASEAGFTGLDKVYTVRPRDSKCMDANFFGTTLKVGDNIDDFIVKVPILGLANFHERSTPELPIQWDKMKDPDHKAKLKKALKAAESGEPGYRTRIHKASTEGWNNFSNDLIASPDPEVQGYLQWYWDVAHGKAPNLSGKYELDLASASIGCGAGLRRKGCKSSSQMWTVPDPSKNSDGPYKQYGPYQARPIVWSIKKGPAGPYADPHTLGLAVDIMVNSNNDIKMPGTKAKGRLSGDCKSSFNEDDLIKRQKLIQKNCKFYKTCTTYKKTLEKMFAGEYGDFFVNDPYKLKRLFPVIDKCLKGERAPWSFPDGWIKLAVKNNFYFGGWAWEDKFRADGMHHEFWGNCYKLSGVPID